MADFLLNIGVDTGASFGQMQKDINSLVSQLNSNPPKIRVGLEIDPAAMTGIRAQIAELSNIAASAGTTSRSGGGGNFRRGAQEAQEYTVALRTVLDTYTQMHALMSGNANASNAQTWTELSTRAQEFATVLELVQRENLSVTEVLRQLGINGADFIEQARTAMSAFRAEVEHTGTSGTVSMNQVYTAIAQMQTLLNNNTNAAGLGSYTELQNNLNLFNEAARLATTESISLEEAFSRVGLSGAGAIEQARTAMSAFRAEVSGATIDEANISAGSKQFNTALKEINLLLGQVTNNLKNWSAAKKGISSGSYEELQGYAQQLQVLQQQLFNGTINPTAYANQMAEIRAGIVRTTAEIKSAGEATQTWSSRIGNLSSKFGAWFGITRVIMMAVRTIKLMIKSTMELESAMAQLKIVTNATDAQMETFLVSSTRLAKELGKSITDVLSSIEVFSRLGYNLVDAEELAKYANILSNVASVDTKTATTGLTSIIKGYGMDVAETEHIADVLVDVGQKYAISAEELMTSFQRGGAALAATGTDFEKSAALFAATNASLQNAETTGTLWKTVSARIRGAKTELEELGEDTEDLAQGLSKYREEFKALSGVDIMKDANTYKDMYDIFVEVAGVWDSITSDTSKARISEILGGTRQLSGIMSTITNIKDAMGAYESAMNSAGTATNANSIYMETAQAHINQLKASFQEFSANLISGGFISGVVSIGNGLINFLNILAKLQLLLPTIAASIALISAKRRELQIEQSISMVSGLSNAIIKEKGVTDTLLVSVTQLTMGQKKMLVSKIEAAAASGLIDDAQKAQILSTLGLAGAEGTLDTANKSLAASFIALKASIPVWGWIALGISGAISAYSWLNTLTKSSKTSIEDLNKEWKELTDTIQNTANNFQSLKTEADDVIPRYAELAQGVDMYGQNISLTDDEFAEFISLNNRLGKMFPDLVAGYDSNGNAILNLSGDVDTLTKSLNDCLEAQRQVALNEISGTMPDVIKNITQSVEKYEKSIDDVQTKIQEIQSGSQSFDYSGTAAQAAKESARQIELQNQLKKLGIDYETEIAVDGTITIKWESDSTGVDNAVAGYEKQIADINSRISAKWKELNPVLSAWMQTDYLYNDLDQIGQDIVSRLVGSIDFKSKGYTTAEEVQGFIQEHIISPLHNAEPEVQNAIQGLFEFNKGFANEDIATVGEYRTLVDNVIRDLRESGLDGDIISQIKIDLDLDGLREKMSHVTSILSDDYDSMVDSLTASELEFAYQIDAEEGSMTFDELKEKIEEVKFQNAPMVNVFDFGNMTSNLDKAKNGLDGIIDAMDKLRGGTALTKSELAQLALEYPKLLEASNLFTDGSIQGQQNMLNTILDMHEQEFDAEIDKKIAELDATEQVLQDQLDLEAQKADLIQEIKNIEVNGVLGQEEQLVTKISALNDLQGRNFVNMEEGELTVNQEALNDHLKQDTDFGKKASTNIWTPFAKVIKTAHTKGFSAALQAANNYGSKLSSWAHSVGGVLSGVASAVKDALSGEWKGLKAYFSGVSTGITAGDVTVTFDGGNVTVGEQSLHDWVSEQEAASNERIEKVQELIKKTINAKNNLAALKGLKLNDVYGKGGSGGGGGGNGGGGNKDKSGKDKEVDEYIAEVNEYNEALQKLKDTEQEQAKLERELEHSDNSLEKVEIQKKLNNVYKDRQDALHELNNLRDNTIHNTIPALEALGFQIEYNDETNRLYIANLEHLNDLQADSAGKYETVQEATNALRKDTEELIDSITNLNSENEKSSEEWLKFADSIKQGKDNIVKYLNEVVSEAVDFVSSVQDIYKTLQDAATEYAENGALSVDVLKTIAEYGAEYMNYLKDENGMLSINKERIEAVITARTKQLAVDTALSYVEKIRHALTENNVYEINRLIAATDKASDATWELVYSNLALLDLDKEQYSQALENINRLRSLANNAVESIKLGNEETNKSYGDMQDALDTILDLTMDLVEYEVDKEIEALEDQKDKYREIIDLKKKALEETKKESDYNKEVAKKVAEIAKLQSKINKLSLDDSREAQAEKASLEEELSKLQTDLTDYQTDYGADKQKEMLDEMADSYEEEKDKEIETLKNSVSSTEKIYQLAIEKINNNWDGLYDDIINWNYEAGSSIQSEIVDAWNLASKAVKEYGSYVEATKRITDGDVNGYTDLGISTHYGDPNAIKSQIRQNSLKWFVSDKDEQAKLSSTNKNLASQLSEVYEQDVISKDGQWYVDGKTDPLYYIDKWEAVDYITNAMHANSERWKSATPAERVSIEAANENMAKYIASLSGQNVWKDPDGVWWIDKDKLYEAYGTFHTGGVVGDSTLKKDEVMAILKDGELVIDEQREAELYRLVDFAQMLSERLGTTIDTNKFGNLFGGFSLLPTSKDLLPSTKAGTGFMAFSPNIEVNISHNGSLTDNDAKRYGGMIAETALGELKDAFTKKGYTNIGNSALK